MDGEGLFRKADASSKWYFRAFFVLAALVLFGPLVFPLLWKSPHFSRYWKWVLTIGFTLATAAMIFHAWHVSKNILEEFKKAGLI